MRKQILYIVIFLSSSLSSADSNTPASWYKLPEQNFEQGKGFIETAEENESTEKLEKVVDAVFHADQKAVESGVEGKTFDASNFSKKPQDWTPWRAEMFMTDLSLSVGGLLGALMTKGTATVRAYWRKQYPAQSQGIPLSDESDSSEGSINVTDVSTTTDVTHQIDTVISAAVRAKKVQDTPLLRAELLNAAKDFQNLAYSLNQTNPDLPWWVQRFRVDFAIDGSGHVNPAVTVGGEVRFRFEWHRIKRKAQERHFANVVTSGHPISGVLDQKQLNTFVKNMSEDLDQAFTNMNNFDFVAHTARMGIGVSAKGNIGVVKGSTGVVGQIYFTRDIKRPVKNPKPIATTTHDELLMIQREPTSQEINFADLKHINYEINSLKHSGNQLTSNPITEAVYKVNRENFRNGLKKAAKVSEFFARRAAKQKSAGWKIYELRTAFDGSISGELTMATLQGAVTAQLNFFNKNF